MCGHRKGDIAFPLYVVLFLGWGPLGILALRVYPLIGFVFLFSPQVHQRGVIQGGENQG